MPSLNKRRRSSKNKRRRRGGLVERGRSVESQDPELFKQNPIQSLKHTPSPTEDDYSLKSFIDRAKELSARFPSDEVLNEKIIDDPKTVHDNAINLTSRLYSKIKNAQDFDTIISGFGGLALEEVANVLKLMKKNDPDFEPPKAWTTDFNDLNKKLDIARNMNTDTDESVLNTLKELFPNSKFNEDDIHNLTPQDIKVSGEPPKLFEKINMTNQGGGSKSKRKSKRKGGRSKNKNKTKRKSKRKSGGNGRLNIWGPPRRGETSHFTIINWILGYFFIICLCSAFFITTFRNQHGDQPLRDTLVSMFDHGPTSTEAGRAAGRAGLGYTFTYAHHALDMIVHFAFGRIPMRYVDDVMAWSAVSHAFLSDNNRLMSNTLNRVSTLIIDWSLYLLMGVIYVVYFIRIIGAKPEEKRQIDRNLMKWLTMISLIKTILRVCWGLLLRQAAYNSQPDIALSLLQRVMGWGSSHNLWLNVHGIVTWDAVIMMPISYYLLQGRTLPEYLGVGTVGALSDGSGGGGTPLQLGYGSGGGGGSGGGSGWMEGARRWWGTPQLPSNWNSMTQEEQEIWFQNNYPMGNQ
jgi:hypothetical protein